MDIKEIYSNIDNLTAQLDEMTAKLKEAAKMAINESAKENPNNLKRVGKNAFIINFSQIMGNPWNPSFYDWDKSAEFVVDYLKNKPCMEWKDILQEKLKKATGNVVAFEKKLSIGGYSYTNITSLDKNFIQKIVDRL